jgi:uncharacterized membrane protein
MQWLKAHLRTKIAAGLLAVIPILLLVWIIYWIETNTSRLAIELLGFNFPGMGILLTILVIYLLGLLVTSLVGRIVLKILDVIYHHIPGLNVLYQTWKDMTVPPPDQASIGSRILLVPGVDGQTAQIGFAVSESVPEDPNTCRVFLPTLPNPLSGRLVTVARASCLPLKLSVGEAVTFVLSVRKLLSREPLDQSDSGEPPEQQPQRKT